MPKMQMLKKTLASASAIAIFSTLISTAAAQGFRLVVPLCTSCPAKIPAKEAPDHFTSAQTFKSEVNLSKGVTIRTQNGRMFISAPAGSDYVIDLSKLIDVAAGEPAARVSSTTTPPPNFGDGNVYFSVHINQTGASNISYDNGFLTVKNHRPVAWSIYMTAAFKTSAAEYQAGEIGPGVNVDFQ